MDKIELTDGESQLIDVLHLGREHVIGAWLAERFPEAEVWVHERGAPHLIDPSKLLASATRLYGERMQELWGEVLAVPAERIMVLRGGERLGPFRVAYTPGHASHHVSYLHEPSRRAFTGDVAGVRIGAGLVLAPTPPPDIDLQAWRASLELIEAWRPRSLAVTHFGAYADVDAHLAALRVHLDEVEAWAGELDQADFAAKLRARALGPGNGATSGAYGQALPAEQSYQGLKRYLHKRGQG